MKRYCPLTKKVAFARLDKRLSEEEKRKIVKSKDMCDFHFSLGLWIRNTWIYGNEEERVEALAKDLGEEFFIGADFLSSTILEAYQKHLKENNGK